MNHYAAKVVQNVAVTTGVHAQKFAVNEVGLFLWYIYTHSTVDSLRVTALSVSMTNTLSLSLRDNMNGYHDDI